MRPVISQPNYARNLYMAMSPDGESIATGNDREEIQFWRVFPKDQGDADLNWYFLIDFNCAFAHYSLKPFLNKMFLKIFGVSVRLSISQHSSATFLFRSSGILSSFCSRMHCYERPSERKRVHYKHTVPWPSASSLLFTLRQLFSLALTTVPSDQFEGHKMPWIILLLSLHISSCHAYRWPNKTDLDRIEGDN